MAQQVPLDKHSGSTHTSPRIHLGEYVVRTLTGLNHLLHQKPSLPTVYKKSEITKSESKKKNPESELEKIDHLKHMLQQSHDVLAQATTVFPLTLFPHNVIVDRNKITIIKRDFFWSADMVCVRIEDVLNVTSSVGPFFGSITISSRVMNSVDHFEINHLWRRDAMIVKYIIQGYMIVRQSNIDISHLSHDELVEALQELGHDAE